MVEEGFLEVAGQGNSRETRHQCPDWSTLVPLYSTVCIYVGCWEAVEGRVGCSSVLGWWGYGLRVARTMQPRCVRRSMYLCHHFGQLRRKGARCGGVTDRGSSRRGLLSAFQSPKPPRRLMCYIPQVAFSSSFSFSIGMGYGTGCGCCNGRGLSVARGLILA